MTIAEFTAQMAVHVAHERGWTIEESVRWVKARLIEAVQEYHEAGAPLGDTDAGFLAWLMPRKQPSAA